MPQVIEPVAAGFGDTILGQQLRALGVNRAKIAEAFQRCGSGSRGVHPARNVLPDALLDVEADLVLHLGLRRLLEGASATPR